MLITWKLLCRTFSWMKKQVVNIAPISDFSVGCLGMNKKSVHKQCQQPHHRVMNCGFLIKQTKVTQKCFKTNYCYGNYVIKTKASLLLKVMKTKIRIYKLPSSDLNLRYFSTSLSTLGKPLLIAFTLHSINQTWIWVWFQDHQQAQVTASLLNGFFFFSLLSKNLECCFTFWKD